MSEPDPSRVSLVPVVTIIELKKPSMPLASLDMIVICGGGGFNQPTLKNSPNYVMVCSSIVTFGSRWRIKSLCVTPDGENTEPMFQKKPLTKLGDEKNVGFQVEGSVAVPIDEGSIKIEISGLFSWSPSLLSLATATLLDGSANVGWLHS